MKTWKTILIIAMLLGGSCWAKYRYSLYTDKKGKQVGDVLTILILESADAENKASTKTGQDSDVDIGWGRESGDDFFTLVPNAGLKGGLNHDYKGEGNTARQGSLEATVSVQIIEVLDNGNLVISGSKEVTLNDNTEVLEVSGVIRPEDINSSNMVYSNKIADAVIKYSGDGVIDDAQKPGIFTRFLNWLF